MIVNDFKAQTKQQDKDAITNKMIDLLKQRETIEKTKNKLMNMSEASFY